MLQRIYFFFTIFFSLLIISGYAQTPHFKYLTADEGLAHNLVYNFLQDKEGLMWIATPEGLNRYDGYKVKIYAHDPKNPQSLPHSLAVYLYEDKAGELWVGTAAKGISKYNRQKDHFISYNQGIDVFVREMCQDEQGNYWAVGDNFFGTLDSKTGTFNNLITKYFKEKRDYSFKYIISLGKGAFYIGDWSKGLIHIDTKTGKVKEYGAEVNGKFELGKVLFQGMYLDKEGILWIATKEGGLTKFDPQNEQFAFYKYDENNPQSLSSNRLLAMQENGDELWLATENAGVSIFDKKIGIFTNYKNDPTNPNSLNDNSVWAIYKDKQGRMWAGTYSNGANIWDKRAEKFPKIEVPLKNKVVNALLKDSKGRTWLGTEGGLVRIDIEGKVSYFEHDPKNPKSLGFNPVLSLVEDKKGRIWAGTWIGGLNLLDEKDNTFERFYEIGEFFPKTLANSAIGFLYQSKISDKLYIGTFNGLSIMDINDTKNIFSFRTDKDNLETLSDNFITTILEDSQHRTWVATTNGLNLFDVENKKFKRFQNDTTNAKSLINNNINGITEDKNGNLWIATSKGLDCMEKVGEFTHYGIANGLKNEVLNGVLTDEQGNIWVSSNQGISMLNVKTKKFRNYDESDGLQSKQFKPRSFYKDQAGLLYFGGVKGANRFDPKQIMENPEIPKLMFTDLKIFNQSVQIGDYDSLLKNQISQTQEITLTHTQSVFSIDYVALSFTQSEKNQYAYQLEGFDKDWNYVGSQRSATYTNLDAGTYIFRVKASNNDGAWNEEGISLTINILPPWWETWWFRAGVISMFLISAYSYYKARMEFLKKQNLKLETQVVERTQEISRKGKELELANHQIKNKNEELLASEEELRQNMEELEANQELIKLQRDNLEKTLEELESKNLRITDSIRYAKRIQNAILPHEEVLKQAFPEHFVIYKPKDVVSGDFYWYFETMNNEQLPITSEQLSMTNDELIMTNEKQQTTNNQQSTTNNYSKKRFLAVVDCTGHGVPGAMMSMMGCTLLKEIIETKQVHDPSAILTELNIRLVQALSSRQESFEDGMDICLCSIEQVSKEQVLVKYSGAKRPLYYVDNQLYKIQGDKFSIGRRHKSLFHYQQQQIFLPTGSGTLFLCSDGLVDSVNIARMRYGSKRLKDFLEKIAHLPLHTQKEMLLQDLETYTQGAEQRDDVLMVGVRV